MEQSIVDLVSYLDARMPDKQNRSKGLIAVYIALTVIGLLIVAAPGSAGAGLGQFCDCETPIRAILSYTVVAVATVVFWIGSIVKRPIAWVSKTAAVLGYLGTAGVVIFGFMRAISDSIFRCLPRREIDMDVRYTRTC